MQVIIKSGGPDAGIYFRTEDDLAAFKASPEFQAMAPRPWPAGSFGDLLSTGGFKVVVATPGQWAAMEAMVVSPADAGAEAV